MSEPDQPIELVPFSREGAPPVRLTGRVDRSGAQFCVRFSLTGALEAVRLPEGMKPALRRDELWKSTCFEWFIGAAGSEGYREFNLAPTGDWNAYRFDGYRQGMRAEAAITALPFKAERRAEGFSLTVQLDLATCFAGDLPLQASMSAVLTAADGRCSYWALCHPAPTPDFHHRDGFILRL